MKINLFTRMAGPDGTREPGVHDVHELLADELIYAGYAEEYVAPVPEKTQPEKAVARKPENAARYL